MNVYLNEDVAEEYDKYYLTPQGISVDAIEKQIIKQLIQDVPAGTILELGCGTGHWTQFFCENGFQVTATDASEEMLKIARAKNIHKAIFQKADAGSLPFPDNSFSTIVAITMLEFVDDIEAVLNEIDRVLIPGGVLILGCLNINSELGKIKNNDDVFRHARFFSPEEIEKMFLCFGIVKMHSGIYYSPTFELLDGTDKQNEVNPAFIGVIVHKNKNMEISVEISYYALQGDYNTPVEEFLGTISKNKEITVESGIMSTLISGEYSKVMELLSQSIKPLMEKYPSVFTLKIANACKTCKK
ncbi:class I SAM-dependent methyltransferase [Maribellus comscasis]|nr:class I SAM-dependent methyltransferase [Maribellus comscasis]